MPLMTSSPFHAELLARGLRARAERPECRAQLSPEDLRLLPRREVATLWHLVVVDERGVGPLGPAPGSLVLLAGEHRHGDRDLGDTLGIEEAALVFPVETRSGDPGSRQPVEGDVVEDLVPRELAGGARCALQCREDGGRGLAVVVGVV